MSNANAAVQPGSLAKEVQASQMLSLSEVGLRLNVSERTCRRWVKAGRIAAVRVDLPSGFAYRVDPDVVSELQKKENSPTPSRQTLVQEAVQEATQDIPEARQGVQAVNHTPSLDGAALVELVGRQQTEISRLHDAHLETVSRLTGQVGFLQAENNQLKEQMRLLKAPVKAVESEPEAVSPSPVEAVEPESEVVPPAVELVESKHRRWYYLWLKVA